MVKKSFIAILIMTCSCASDVWRGGVIDREGVYISKDVTIEVEEKDWSLKYIMISSKGDTLVKSDGGFSTFHRWALHLDQNNNLWVFNSDVGYSSYMKDSISKRYIKHEYMEVITDPIPEDVSKTMLSFE